jgi:hypothetical protein
MGQQMEAAEEEKKSFELLKAIACGRRDRSCECG